ncbi:MAG: SRPBCC domain-containing protein [bacterium]
MTISDPPATTLGAPTGPGRRGPGVDAHPPRPRGTVWAAWSSAEGTAAQFADEVRMELRIGGPFEILFFGPEVAERGSEGSKVLAFVPGRLLAFSWNAPPHLKHTRPQLTWVTVELADADAGTNLTLTTPAGPRPASRPAATPTGRPPTPTSRPRGPASSTPWPPTSAPPPPDAATRTFPSPPAG